MKCQANLLTRKQIIAGFAAATLIGSADAAIIASDPIEALADYTKTGNAWANTGAYNVFRGLTAFDLTAGTDLFIYGSNGSDNGMNSTFRLTAGFGPSVLVEAGTYSITAYSGVGDLSPSRQAFQTFNVMLMTLAGVEWSGGGIIKTVTTAYVDPNPQHTIDGLEIWVPSTVQYVIPEGHALIGTQFTWAFNGTKINDATGYAFSVDNAFVDFVPEPGSLALLSLGGLCLLRRRRA